MLVFFYGGESEGPRPGHVGIYSGQVMMINAPYSGTVVRYDEFSTRSQIGPLDFWGATDPAQLLLNPPPLPPPATLCDVQLRVLQDGFKGYDVRSLQWLLNGWVDAKLDPDAIFGPLTKTAVEDFQRKLGYKVDGVVGAQTWRGILGAPNPEAK